MSDSLFHSGRKNVRPSVSLHVQEPIKAFKSCLPNLQPGTDIAGAGDNLNCPRPNPNVFYDNLKDHIPIKPNSHNMERDRIVGMPDKEDTPALVNGSLDILTGRYFTWVNSPVVYAITREVITSYQSPAGYMECFTQLDTLFRKGAKRGNPEYIEAVKERIADYNNSLPSVQFFNPKERKEQSTRMLYMVLTTDPKKFKSRYHAWCDIGNRVNKFSSNLKRFYNCEIHISRSWECFYQKALGYPHVNLVVLLKDKSVSCFPQTRKKDKKRVWRIHDKSSISKYWKSGFIDVYAISRVAGINEDYADSLNGTEDPIRDNSVLSVAHMVKYMTKNMREKNPDKKTLILNALLWIMRKRSFSLSNQFFNIKKEISEFIHSLSNSNKFYPGTLNVSVKYRLLGVYPGCVNKCKTFHGGLPPPGCPYNRHNEGCGECPYSQGGGS